MLRNVSNQYSGLWETISLLTAGAETSCPAVLSGTLLQLAAGRWTDLCLNQQAAQTENGRISDKRMCFLTFDLVLAQYLDHNKTLNGSLSWHYFMWRYVVSSVSIGNAVLYSNFIVRFGPPSHAIFQLNAITAINSAC